MKRKAFTLVEFIVVVLIVAVLAAILYPVLAPRPPHGSPRASCQQNLKQLGLGFLQYAQDAGEKFPAASVEWGQAVQPYVKDWNIYHCPSATGRSDEQTTDYFVNARVANVPLEKYGDRFITILAGDGLPAQPLDTSLTQLPQSWRTDESSPAQRHLNTASYLFADGHVKSLKPEQVTLQPTAKSQPTFLVK